MKNVYLLIKYYQKEASEEETWQVSEWLKADKRNQKAYEDYIRIWLHSQRSSELEKTNPKFEWQKIAKETAKNPRSYSLFYKVAAAVAILILLLVLYKEQSPKQLITNNETRGSVKEILLPDSTKVFLNYLGSIEYPSSFTNSKREVKLTGQAYFEVKRDTKRQFIIETKQSNVKVLGTSFDCFSTDTSTTVFVNTGKVSLENITGKNQKVILLPGDLGESHQQVVSKKTANDANILSWKTGIFNFKKAPLTKVFSKLEKRYHQTFKYNLKDIQDKVITVSFNNNQLEDILEVIQHTCNVSFEYNVNSTTIKVNPIN